LALTYWLAFGIAITRILTRPHRLAFGRHLACVAGFVALARRLARLTRSCLGGKAGERIGRP
jgi:hypothetical protein